MSTIMSVRYKNLFAYKFEHEYIARMYRCLLWYLHSYPAMHIPSWLLSALCSYQAAQPGTNAALPSRSHFLSSALLSSAISVSLLLSLSPSSLIDNRSSLRAKLLSFSLPLSPSLPPLPLSLYFLLFPSLSIASSLMTVRHLHTQILAYLYTSAFNSSRALLTFLRRSSNLWFVFQRMSRQSIAHDF